MPMALNEGDSGVGAIGRIDHARVTPGTVVKMHPHRDDEILTYLRTGRVCHEDTVGNMEEISSRRLMMMNAGHTFKHEETVLDSGVLTALQIFLRPSAGDLEPQVQFHEFDQVASDGEWRLLAGPAGEAPLEVRAQAWVHDIHLKAGQELDLPPVPAARSARLLYMFAGRARAAGVSLAEGESLLLDGTRHRVSADDDSDLVLFTTDLSAPVFKGGMFSGNALAPR